MPEFETGELEFTVNDHEVIETNEGRVYKIIFFTDDVESGQITTKPTVEEPEIEDGIKKKKEKPAPWNRIPDPVVETLKESLDGEIRVAAEVTEAKNEGEESNFFINDYKLDTLETRVFVDDGGEE